MRSVGLRLLVPAALLLVLPACYPPTALQLSLDSKGPANVSAAFSVSAPTLHLRPIGAVDGGAFAELAWADAFMIVPAGSELPVRIESMYRSGWSSASPGSGQYTKSVQFRDIPSGSYRLVSGQIRTWADTGYELGIYIASPPFSATAGGSYDAGLLSLEGLPDGADGVLRGRVYLDGPLIVTGESCRLGIAPDYHDEAHGALLEPHPDYTGGFSYALPAAGFVDGRASFEFGNLPRRPLYLSDREPWLYPSNSYETAPALDLAAQRIVAGQHCVVHVYRDETQLHENANSFRVRLHISGETQWSGDLAITVQRVDGSTDLFAQDRHWLFPEMLAAGTDPKLHEYETGALETGDYRFEARLYDPAGSGFLSLPLSGGPFLLPSGWQDSHDHSDVRPQLDLELVISAEAAVNFAK